MDTQANNPHRPAHESRHPLTGRPLGLRLPRTTIPAVVWCAWQVVERANGFHVSRESISGARTEALENAVGRTKVFRRRELALAACASANQQRGGAA